MTGKQQKQFHLPEFHPCGIFSSVVLVLFQSFFFSLCQSCQVHRMPSDCFARHSDSGVPLAQQCTAPQQRTCASSLAQMASNHSRRLIFARSFSKRLKSGCQTEIAHVCVCVCFYTCCAPPAVHISHVFPSADSPTQADQLDCFAHLFSFALLS